MKQAFILRFQECIEATETADRHCGTATITAVHAEEIDADPQPLEQRTIPQSAVHNGTMTKTGVPREQSADEDFLNRAQSTLPMVESSRGTGTHTLTNVRAEDVDSDPDSRDKIIPNQNALGTKTGTAVAAEQRDDDPGSLSHKALTRRNRQELVLGTHTMTRVHAETPDEDPGRSTHALLPKCSSS